MCQYYFDCCCFFFNGSSAISCSASNLATVTLSDAFLVGAMVYFEYHLVDRNYLSAAAPA